MYIPVLELYVYVLLASILDPIAGLGFALLVCLFSVFLGALFVWSLGFGFGF